MRWQIGQGLPGMGSHGAHAVLLAEMHDAHIGLRRKRCSQRLPNLVVVEHAGQQQDHGFHTLIS